MAQRQQYGAVMGQPPPGEDELASSLEILKARAGVTGPPS